MFGLIIKKFLSLFLLMVLIGIHGTVQATQVTKKVNKPQYLDIALLQSSNDLNYVKPVQRWFIKIYTEALGRLDITLRYHVLPPKRASVYTDDGRLDGELSRVFDYNTKHPNLVRVEEHHLLSVFSAFAADSKIRLNGWPSLANTNYKIGYRRGIKKSADNLTAMIPLDRLSVINSIQNGVKLLLLGVTDIFIDSEDGVFNYLKSDEFKRITTAGEGAVYKVGIMETVTSHFWLHKKHRGLSPKLSAILLDMKKEGLFDLYFEQADLNDSSLKW